MTRKIRSEPGIRTFARVELREEDGNKSDKDENEDETDEPLAMPTRASGSGILSSVALADGWVEVPESREGIPEGETVPVQNWEWSA